jgi:hypothetical protein
LLTSSDDFGEISFPFYVSSIRLIAKGSLDVQTFVTGMVSDAALSLILIPKEER